MKNINKLVIGIWIAVVILNLCFFNFPAAFNAGVVILYYWLYLESEERTKRILREWKKSVNTWKKAISQNRRKEKSNGN